MANQAILGLYSDVDTAAAGARELRAAGFSGNDYDILTGAPYPEGAFGEELPPHRLFRFPFIGALSGFSVALLITMATQLSMPLITGGKPLFAFPAMIIIMYEGTMLGAVLFTILGILFESRMPRLKLGPYDARITEGYVGVVVTCPDERVEQVEDLFRRTGAEEVSK